MDSEIITLIVAFFYFLLLMYSVNKKQLSKDFAISVSLGILSGVALTVSIEEIIVTLTNYNMP